MKKQSIRRIFLLLAALLMVALLFCGVAFAEPGEQLSLHANASTGQVSVGETLTCTVIVTNMSGSQLTGISIKIDMPQDKMQPIGYVPEEGTSCSEEAIWTIPVMAPGQEKSITLMVEVTNVKMDEIVTCSASIEKVSNLPLTKPNTVFWQFTVVCGSHSGGTATCTEKAVCGFCGEEYGEIDPFNHTNLVKTEAKAATCTEAGNIAYWYCDACGKYFSDKNGTTPITLEGTVIPATGHDWGEPTYQWSDDGKTCTATRVCQNDETHVETAEATVTGTVTREAACAEPGETTYTAVFTADWASAQTKTLKDIPALGHDYKDGKCTVCGAMDPDFKAAITAGANGIWQKGTKSDLSFTSNAAFAHFLKVQVDGKDLDASSYTVKEGSTIVTLKAEYLETLSVGKHTLAIVSETGTAETEFTIKAAAAADDTQSPQTGDNSNVTLWIALLFVSGGALCAGIVSRKRKSVGNRWS